MLAENVGSWKGISKMKLKLIIYTPHGDPTVLGTITKAENGDVIIEVTDKDVIEMFENRKVSMSMELPTGSLNADDIARIRAKETQRQCIFGEC